MSELPFSERDRCGLYTLLENDIVQFVIAKDKRDGMTRATQITLLDQSFLKYYHLVNVIVVVYILFSKMTSFNL